jgi:hypothetical protein
VRAVEVEVFGAAVFKAAAAVHLIKDELTPIIPIAECHNAGRDHEILNLSLDRGRRLGFNRYWVVWN